MILLAKDVCKIAAIPVSLKIAGFRLATVTAQTISERKSPFLIFLEILPTVVGINKCVVPNTNIALISSYKINLTFH